MVIKVNIEVISEKDGKVIGYIKEVNMKSSKKDKEKEEGKRKQVSEVNK